MTSPSAPDNIIDTNFIIGTRWYCTRCMLEHVELIDRNGIPHAEFKLYKRVQVCEQCKSKNFLEFFPIYKGEQILDVTNQMARENSERERKRQQEQNIDWEREYDRLIRKEEIKIEWKERNKTPISSATAPDVPDKDYAEFVIDIARRTVKQENSLVRQIFYTALSKDTADPANLMIQAPTSEGKTWPVTEVLRFFPSEDILFIGRMSTMTLVRERGILVDSINNPVKDKIRQLKRDISKTKAPEEREKLEDELDVLMEDVRSVISLKGKLIVFLEPPQTEVWDLIKPILSHDKEEIEYPFVNNTAVEGIMTKKVVVRGSPACIFCTAKDESNWPSWPEIVSRFLITSPNMISKKYEESNLLIAQRKSLPSFVQEQIIISNADIEMAKKCVGYLIEKLRGNGKNQIWIPYGEILGEALKAEKGTDSRAAKRIFSFLNVIPLVKADLRPRLIIKDKITMIIATLEDLNEALSITQNYSGIATNKMDFYTYDLFSLYKAKIESGTVDEDGVTTKEMAEAHKLRKHRSLNSDAVRKSFLYELMNNGYVEEEESTIDKRRKIYRPLIEPELEPEKIQKLRESVQSHNLLQPSVIILPRNCKTVPENWLVLQVLSFLNCRIDSQDGQRIAVEDMNFYDCRGTKQTITQFVTEYEYTYSLILYFKKANYCKFYTTQFRMSSYVPKSL